MNYEEVLGLSHLKNHLQSTVANQRISHAQLFVGKGVLPLALAYAQDILCQPFDLSDKQACATKVSKFSHPDLHFVYPVATTTSIKDKPISNDFLTDWRSFLAANPYADLFDWLKHFGVEKKQGNISVHEAKNLIKQLALKPFEGGYQVVLIWMAEKMNTECANKLLKLLEEPPQKTIFILIAEEKESILPTILSRCQLLEVPLLPDAVIAHALEKNHQVDNSKSNLIAKQSEGLYNNALKLLQSGDEVSVFEQWVIKWVRAAFRAKKNKGVINDLIEWSENIAGSGRETQKMFLDYCLSFFRQAMLLNYKADALVYLKFKDSGFSLEKFAPFVHGNNSMEIINEIEKAYLHIERNGNAKMIFTDLSIKLTRLLHTPS